MVSFSYIYKDTKRDQINDLAYKSSVIKKFYELSFQQWELSLLSVGNRLTEIESDSLKLQYVRKALKLYEDDLLAFGFAEPDGQVIIFSGNDYRGSFPNLSTTPQTSRSFEDALQKKGISLGEVYFFDNVQDWILPIRVPIRDENDSIVAVNTSAIDYSSVVEDLGSFGFTDCSIHLINPKYKTTQILYPMSESLFSEVLGSSDYTYSIQDSTNLDDDTYFFSSVDPLSKKNIFGVSTEISPVDHCLFISVESSFLWNEVLVRFRYIFIAYLFLTVASFLLYRFLRKNLHVATARVKSERANLKTIIESTEDIIGLFSPELKLLVYNNAFAESTKQTDGFDLYEGIYLFDHMRSQEYATLFKSFFAEALQGKKVIKEVIYPSPDGGELCFRFTYNPVYEQGEIKGVSLFAENNTEIRNYQKQLEEYNQNLESTVKERTRELEHKNQELERGYRKLKSAQQQLIKAEKMASLGVLAAGIGHEINNPLNFIKHGASTLQLKLEKAGGDGSKGYEEYFHAINEGVSRASGIVKSLSHFSRTGDKLSESCDLHVILENCLAILQSRFRNKTIKVQTNLAAHQHVMQGNEGKLHQVFTNLIANAEQAIQESGEIVISTENVGEGLIISVEDSGEGIPAEILDRISDPFFTTKDPGVGTGLGLFITYQIIDEHGGKIEVRSQVGKGTVFTVFLQVGKVD